MVIQRGDIVLRREGDIYWGDDHYRVEMVIGPNASVRNLTTYKVSKESVEDLAFLYQIDTFDTGDIVRVRERYQKSYSEVDGYNDLKVVHRTANVTAPTVRVRNNYGDEFDILTERLFLDRPAKGFKAGDRVVVDPELVKKYSNDGESKFWENVGVLVLTEDSGSRMVKHTSHVRYEDSDDKATNNVPTRWLKLYEEPAKRVVGGPIQSEDVKVGDTIRATYTYLNMIVSSEGVVSRAQQLSSGEQALFTTGGARFPLPYVGTIYTLLEEAPEPVDENLQRLLDAEVGDVAHGTYADEYWKQVGDGEWKLVGDPERPNVTANTGGVFMSLDGIKYGMLDIYRKVEYVD